METSAAILLRKRKFSDTSLIVSWCTESFGCIQTVAKGARRAKSPFAGKLDLFFEAEISIVRSRKSDLHTLAEVVLKNLFAGIRSNYLRLQTAAYFVELIEICTERDHREPELFGLGGAHAMKRADLQIEAVRALAAKHPETWELATTAADIRRIASSGKIAALMGLEGGYAIISQQGRWSEIFGSRGKAARFAKEDRRGHRSELRKNLASPGVH